MSPELHLSALNSEEDEEKQRSIGSNGECDLRQAGDGHHRRGYTEPKQVSNTYYALAEAHPGRLKSKTQSPNTPDAQTTYYDYTALGELKRTWGAG